MNEADWLGTLSGCPRRACAGVSFKWLSNVCVRTSPVCRNRFWPLKTFLVTFGRRMSVNPALDTAGARCAHRQRETQREMGVDSAQSAPRHIPSFPWGDTAEEEHYARKGVQNQRQFVDSGRGLQLYTQSWVPLKKSVRALIFMVHGYGNDTSWTFQNTAMFFTDMGCASFALDLEGHGRSGGLKGYIPDIDAVTHDCHTYFTSIKRKQEFTHLPCFLYGESMGGAICLLLHFMAPEAWNGAILVAPMCKISDKMRPPWPVAEILTVLARWAPTWPIVPTKDLVDKSIKDPIKRELGRNNPQRYSGKPRLGTTVALLKTTGYLEEHLQDVNMPFLVIHGDADVVTDPSVSQELFDNAKSSDKAIRIYKGMMHSLLQGEYDDNVSIILADISLWLDDRIKKMSPVEVEGLHQ